MPRALTIIEHAIEEGERAPAAVNAAGNATGELLTIIESTFHKRRVRVTH